MTSKMHFTSRTGAALLLLAVLLTMCFPLTLSAEEAAETPAFYAEPVLTRADDYTEALTGFRLVADNPESLALTLTYSVHAAGEKSRLSKHISLGRNSSVLTVFIVCPFVYSQYILLKLYHKCSEKSILLRKKHCILNLK